MDYILTTNNDRARLTSKRSFEKQFVTNIFSEGARFAFFLMDGQLNSRNGKFSHTKVSTTLTLIVIRDSKECMVALTSQVFSKTGDDDRRETFLNKCNSYVFGLQEETNLNNSTKLITWWNKQIR